MLFACAIPSPSITIHHLNDPVVSTHAHPSTNTMNRQKKLKQLFKAKAKKASAKLAPANKNTYVSKADRLKLAAEAEAQPITPTES
jgi:hypothetical protein